MTIKQQIESIIANRQQYQPEFVRYFDEVSKMRDFVNGVNGFKSNSGWLAMVNGNQKLKKEWDSLVLEAGKLQTQLNALCDGENGCLMECLKRVKRDYLNIGCVGPWRQGKSTVISKLTNLSDYVIPRSKFLTCTGTTINIFNGNQVVWKDGQYEEKDGNKAVVYYHSFKSICKTINDYLKDLGLNAMPYASTRESFIHNCNQCYHTNSGNPGNNSKLKEMLDMYLLHASDYVDSLKPQDGMFDEITSLSSIESQKRLRPLVSYYEHTDAEYAEMGIQKPPQVFFVSAVKKVDVYTTFSANGENGRWEVGKIQFVDTPGLGESKLEVADILANSLRSELDIAICLRKVSNQAGIILDDSYDFHEVLKQNTFGRKPENWIFYLYNKEGNVAEDILQTTFSKLNENLANKIVNGLQLGQTVGGIKLKYDLSNPVGNHIDFIDAYNETDKLQRFFMSILTEMSRTIADSDNAFYQDAREGFQKAQSIFRHITGGTLKNISQCLPTFDNREKIINTIKSIDDAWTKTVQCPSSLKGSINAALSQCYNESYGVVLAYVLGISNDKIEKMSSDIKAVEKTPEMKPSVRLAKREQVAKDVIYPVIQQTINQQVIDKKQVQSKYGDWKNALSEEMIRRALSFIKDADIIDQVENVKTIVWRALMNEGQLALSSTIESEWIENFLKILEEGGADFSALRDSVSKFYTSKFDIEAQIKSIVKGKIDKIAIDTQVLQGNIDNIHESIFKTLYDAESKTKGSIQSECGSVVEGQLAIELNKFNNEVITFQTTIIPASEHLLTYKEEFEQLIKFYNKYSNEIFCNDDEAQLKLAVKEWNVLQLKYMQ